MQTTFSRTTSYFLTLVLGAGLGACGPDKDDDGDDGTGTGDTGTGTGTDAGGDDGDGDGGTDTGGGGSGTGDGGSGDDGGTGDGGSDTGGGTSGPTEPQPNGEPCTANEDCESMACYMIPMLGGTCSECLEDADCMENGEAGTCSVDIGTGMAVCTDGNLGDMCMSDDACMGDLVCGQLADLMGFFPADFCSDCKEDGDCDQGQTCSPHYDTAGISGWLTCVDPGSVPNGDGCPVEAGGANPDGSVCESGYCATADVGGFGFVFLGVCSECDPATGDGCSGGETCMEATADLNGAQPATCG